MTDEIIDEGNIFERAIRNIEFLKQIIDEQNKKIQSLQNEITSLNNELDNMRTYPQNYHWSDSI